MYNTRLKVLERQLSITNKTVILLLWKHIECTLQYYTYFNYAAPVLAFTIRAAYMIQLWSDFKTDNANVKLLIFEYRFLYYKYTMLTNNTAILKHLFVPCSCICSPFANVPSCGKFSNYRSYALSSLCISPISFISAFSYFAVFFFLEIISTTIPATIASVTTTMTAITPAVRPCIENSGGFSST